MVDEAYPCSCVAFAPKCMTIFNFNKNSNFERSFLLNNLFRLQIYGDLYCTFALHSPDQRPSSSIFRSARRRRCCCCPKCTSMPIRFDDQHRRTGITGNNDSSSSSAGAHAKNALATNCIGRTGTVTETRHRVIAISTQQHWYTLRRQRRRRRHGTVVRLLRPASRRFGLMLLML